MTSWTRKNHKKHQNWLRNRGDRIRRDAARTPVITELDLIKEDFYEDFSDLKENQETKDKKNLS